MQNTISLTRPGGRVKKGNFGRHLGSVAKNVQAKLDKLSLPPNFKISVTGAVEIKKIMGCEERVPQLTNRKKVPISAQSCLGSSAG
jgi:hypothetical protein